MSGFSMFIIAFVLFLAFLLFRNKTPTAAREMPNATFRSLHGIAIDTADNKIWIRDASGRSVTLDKNQIVSWQVLYETNGNKPFNTRLRLETRDLANPTWTVRFNANGTLSNIQEKNNLADAEEWSARLTAWINHNAT